MKAQTSAKLKFLRMSPQKVRLLINMIRGMKADEAVIQLQYSRKHAARPVKKLLESAMANAVHNHFMDKDSLVVSAAFVDGGPMYKRWQPRAMGRATPLRKRTSHVTIMLEGDVVEQAKKEKAAKKEKKESASAKASAGKEEPKKEAKKVEKAEKKSAKKPKTEKKETKKESAPAKASADKEKPKKAEKKKESK